MEKFWKVMKYISLSHDIEGGKWKSFFSNGPDIHFHWQYWKVMKYISHDIEDRKLKSFLGNGPDPLPLQLTISLSLSLSHAIDGGKLKSFLGNGPDIHFHSSSVLKETSLQPADSISVYTRTAFFINHLLRDDQQRRGKCFTYMQGWLNSSEQKQESFLKKHHTSQPSWLLWNSERNTVPIPQQTWVILFDPRHIISNLNTASSDISADKKYTLYNWTILVLVIESWWIWLNLADCTKSNSTCSLDNDRRWNGKSCNLT